MSIMNLPIFQSYAVKAALVAIFGFSTSPASAEDDDRTFHPTSKWNVASLPEKCSLTRSFGAGDDAVRLVLDKGSDSATFNLTLIGKPVEHTLGKLISIAFGPEEKPSGRHYITAQARSGLPAVVMYGASFAPGVAGEGDSYTIEKFTPERLGAVEYLEVERAGIKRFRLATGSLKAAMAAMDICTGRLTDGLTLAKRSETRPPEPVGNPGTWITPRDYPPLMLRYERDGLVQVRVTISEAGKPSFCYVTSSTTPQMFDDTVCLALMQRAKFKPALDKDGDPVVSYWETAVRFTVS